MYSANSVRGVSVIFASGNGSIGKGDYKVNDNDGPERVQFISEFPATCLRSFFVSLVKQYDGLYKCVFCHDPCLVIVEVCAARLAAKSPTSPRRRSDSLLSMTTKALS